MAASKASNALLTAVITSQTSSAVDTSGDYADTVFASLVVVGTPSGSATFQVQISPDGGTTYYNYGPVYSAPLTAGTYNWAIGLDETAKKVQVVFAAQTGGTSGTFTAQTGQITGV